MGHHRCKKHALYTVSWKKDRQYIGHNFDKVKYIVVISRKEYHEGNAKLLTQQKSASPNQRCYFTLQIRQSPCTKS